MNNSLKILSTNFDDKTKIELAIGQLYSFYFNNNNKQTSDDQRIRTKKHFRKLLLFSKIEIYSKKLLQEKFENTIPYRSLDGHLKKV